MQARAQARAAKQKVVELISQQHPNTFADPLACSIAHSKPLCCKNALRYRKNPITTVGHLISHEPGHWKTLRACRRMRRKEQTAERREVQVFRRDSESLGSNGMGVGAALETVTRITCGRSPKNDGYVILRDAIIMSTQ